MAALNDSSCKVTFETGAIIEYYYNIFHKLVQYAKAALSLMGQISFRIWCATCSWHPAL